MKPDKAITGYEAERIEEFIKTLDCESLLYLNRLVVERIKLIYQEKITHEMYSFNVGDRVAFTNKYSSEIRVRIIQMNKKNVILYTKDGRE